MKQKYLLRTLIKEGTMTNGYYVFYVKDNTFTRNYKEATLFNTVGEAMKESARIQKESGLLYQMIPIV